MGKFESGGAYKCFIVAPKRISGAYMGFDGRIDVEKPEKKKTAINTLIFSLVR